MSKRMHGVQGIDLLSSLKDMPTISFLGDDSRIFRKQMSPLDSSRQQGNTSNAKLKNSLLVSLSASSPRSGENTEKNILWSGPRSPKPDNLFEKIKQKQFRVSAFLKSTEKLPKISVATENSAGALETEKKKPYNLGLDSTSKTHLTLTNYQSAKDLLRSGKPIPQESFNTVVSLSNER